MSALYPCKPEISYAEYLQLMGLLKLAEKHNQALKDLAQTAAEILGQEGDNGHVHDAIYCDYTVDHLLKLMEVKVVTQ